MSDVERRIQERVEAFVQELSVLVRQSVLDSVNDALGGESSGAARGRGGRRPARPARAAGAGRARRKGQKRSPVELERLVGSVRNYVQKNPGQGVEKMARDLGANSRELVLPIKKLIKEGTVRTRGEKRATKYFPGGGRGRKAAKA
jgi:hypothetical protein